jgi:acylphosphatase
MNNLQTVKTIMITISGRVQGVFFRQSTKDQAIRLGIGGFVCNLADGRVQVVCTGTREQLDALIAWSRQGPPRALVTNVEWNEQPLQDFRSFTIARS